MTILPLYWLAFTIGQWVLQTPDGGLPGFAISGDSAGAWLAAAFEWLTTVGKPLLVGIPLLALLLAVIGYAVVRLAWRCHVMYSWRQRAALRQR